MPGPVECTCATELCVWCRQQLKAISDALTMWQLGSKLTASASQTIRFSLNRTGRGALKVKVGSSRGGGRKVTIRLAPLDWTWGKVVVK